MKNEKIEKLLTRINEINGDLTKEMFELNNMLYNNEFDTYLDEYIEIRDSEEYSLGRDLKILINIENVVDSDMKLEDKKTTLKNMYFLTEEDTYHRYEELVGLINTETILTLIDADKCSLGRK